MMDKGLTNDVQADGMVNGGLAVKQEPLENGKGKINELDRTGIDSGASSLQNAKTEEQPDELQHITADIIPLDLLLSRLAQSTYSALQEQIAALASKPVPQNLLTNGDAVSSSGGAVEDASPESLEKKSMLLNFIQDLHAKWVKALVIAEWSKKAQQVGKLIDLRTHLATKLEIFNTAFWELVNVQREMYWAKVPAPDLKTALHVLSYGRAWWFPHFGYLKPPALTLEEKENWLNDINVNLHVRMQLDEFERTPEPFRNYTIDSGRITFRVEGEFEVDLTIGDEDFSKQFWFIDFRVLYKPTPPIADNARQFIEGRVNEALATDGLRGCYKYLHEFILTLKIQEFARQAIELNSTKWVDTLFVERLQRCLSIQYWRDCPHSRGVKSWVILGVNSGKNGDEDSDIDAPSYISLRWFRDGKEVKDAVIDFDVDTISTDALLTTLTSKHIEHLLSSIYNRISSQPRFARSQANLALNISAREPADSSLTMQLLGKDSASLQINPFSGRFTLNPRTLGLGDAERRLNSLANPAEEGSAALEQIRCYYTMRQLNTRGKCLNWNVLRSPVSSEDLKSIVYSGGGSREAYQAIWMKHARWNPELFVMMSLSLGGDQWWLVELSPQKPGTPERRVSIFSKMPMTSSQLTLSPTFFTTLAKYGEAMMGQISTLRELHHERVRHGAERSPNNDPSARLHIPTIFVRLTDLLRTHHGQERVSPTPWAKEFIPIVFKGLEPVALEDSEVTAGVHLSQKRETRPRSISEATLAVADRAKFHFLKGNLDRDVLYNPRIGQFTFRLRTEMDVPSVTLLSTRIKSLQRLIDFVEAIRRAGKEAVPVSATLREIVFTYGRKTADGLLDSPQEHRRWEVRLDLSKEQGVDVILEQGNPHLRVIDYLRSAANSNEFQALPAWLILTLPLFRALDQLEDSWQDAVASQQGSLYVFHKAPAWVTLRFALPSGNRRVNLDIRPRTRKGGLQWFMTRAQTDPEAKNENDGFNVALKQNVWSASGKGYKGLMTGSSATPDHGIENLMALLGRAMLAMTTRPSPQQQQQAQQQQQSVPHQAPLPQQQGLPVGFPPPHHQQQQPQMPQPNMHPHNLAQAKQPARQGPRPGQNNNAPVLILD